jgi:hypothetical protein
MSRVLGEKQQQVELALGELYLLATNPREPRPRVDFEFPERQRLRRLVPAHGSAHDRVHPRHQLRWRERLHDVVVRAALQADDAIGLLTLGGEQDDRDPLVEVFVNPAHDLEPVEAREHDVEHKQVRRAAEGGSHGGGPVRDGACLVAGPLEVPRHHLGNRRLIVDDQDRAARASRRRHAVDYRASRT